MMVPPSSPGFPPGIGVVCLGGPFGFSMVLQGILRTCHPLPLPFLLVAPLALQRLGENPAPTGIGFLETYDMMI